MLSKLTDEEFIRRIWAKVDKSKGENGCWIWLGRIMYRGYGTFSKLYAHRVVYELTFGEIPNGLFVLHKCDNPKCCNPDHLFIGTQTDNMRDMLRKGRRTTAKLTINQVREIRERKGENGLALAREFNIHHGQIYRIWNGQAWGWVDGYENRA